MGRQGDGESGGRGETTLRVAASLLRDAAQRLVAAGIDPDEATLEAEVLLRHVLGIDRAAFMLRRHEPLPDEAAQRFAGLLERRLTREPLAYITGHREFYGLDFAVDRACPDPAPGDGRAGGAGDQASPLLRR